MALFEKKKKAQVDPAPVTKATLTRSIVSSAFILTILSVAVLAYITTAWFSSNRKVDNTGVHMNIQTSPNMIIVNAEDPDGEGTKTPIAYNDFKDLSTAEFDPYNTNHGTRVEFHDPYYNEVGTETLLVPVTRVTPTGYSGATSDVGLYYLNNPSIIGSGSGIKTNTTPDYDLQPVSGNSNPQYYIEHRVLIASADGTLPASALTATFSAYTGTNPDADGVTRYTPDDNNLAENASDMYRYAASVDFYAKAITKQSFHGVAYASALTVSDTDYKGTLNLAQKDENWNILSTHAGNDVKDDPTTENINEANPYDSISLFSGFIPHNNASLDSDNCCILVVMRFYFDGALLWKQDVQTTTENDTTVTTVTPVTAYVHSDHLSIAGMPNLYVKFEATAP